MKRVLTTLSLGFLPGQASAQSLSDYLTSSGYAEFRGSLAQVEGTPWTTQERIRPTLKVYPSDRTALRITIEAQHTQGRQDEAELIEFLDEAIMEQIGMDLERVEELTGCHVEALPRVEELEDIVRVERLFLDINRPSMDLRIGRQPIAWGSALGINPTDVFSEFLLSEPWRERSGVDAMRLTLARGEHQLVVVGGVDDLVGGVQDSAMEWKTGFRATTHIGTTDLSLVGSTSRWRLENDRHFIGVDLKGDWEIGWWLEGGYDGELRVALGADYSFPLLQVLYVAAQLNYEGGGSPPGEAEPTLRSMEDLEICNCQYLPGGISLPVPEEPEAGAPYQVTTGRFYGLINISWTLADDWRLSGFTLWNLEDQTGIAFPYISWLGGQRIAANLGLQTPMGRNGEFRPDPGDLTVQGVDLSGLLPERTALAWVRISI
jgi:hypothetical protein